jgi:hypothetical protein
MERHQQPNEQVVTERTREERPEERTARRLRLRIDALEERVAPNAIWGE